MSKRSLYCSKVEAIIMVDELPASGTNEVKDPSETNAALFLNEVITRATRSSDNLQTNLDQLES